MWTERLVQGGFYYIAQIVKQIMAYPKYEISCS